MKNHALSFLPQIQRGRQAWMSKGVEEIYPSTQKRVEPIGVNDWMEGDNETLRQVRKHEYRHASH